MSSLKQEGAKRATKTPVATEVAQTQDGTVKKRGRPAGKRNSGPFPVISLNAARAEQERRSIAGSVDRGASESRGETAPAQYIKAEDDWSRRDDLIFAGLTVAWSLACVAFGYWLGRY